MSIGQNTKQLDESWWGVPFDLSDIACQAAVELDNLLLGKETLLSATANLVQYLAESIPEDATCVKSGVGLDTATVVAVNRAIDDSHLAGHTVLTIADLATETNKIRTELDSLANLPNGSGKTAMKQVKTLRGFCLALSKRAAGGGMPSQDLEPQHPFRG